ncbi:unnamed protein product [Lactuca virosa]|uniref:Uncharacterized protein n=1 Tax=Lactuca virosa TaxID=75947 RepID=A0AAU9MVF5_9ASTR|nr:unnamed protein product [Lactuca virosa]
MHLFHLNYEIYMSFIWAVDSRDYLSIDHQNAQRLRLSNPVHNIVWRLSSNLGVLMPEPDSDSDEPIPDASAPVHVCEINTKMVEFREEFYSFRDNQQACNQHVDSIVTDMHRVLYLALEVYFEANNHVIRFYFACFVYLLLYIYFFCALDMVMDLSPIMDCRELTRVLEEDMKIVQPQAVEEHGEKTKKNGICLTDA